MARRIMAFGRLADRNERQAGVANPAEHGECVFGSFDSRLGKDCGMERRQAVLDLERKASRP